MIEKRFKLRLSKLGNGMITDIQKKEDLYFDKEFLDATLPKATEWLNKLAEDNEQLNQEIREYIKALNKTLEEKEELWKENEQLKQQLYDCKKDEKQLGISFMEFKMQLIEVLQQNYAYAYNQRQRNLDNSIIAKTYEVLYQTIYNIAETMNVDIERFPKGDDVE